jgi:hypothetical protein
MEAGGFGYNDCVRGIPHNDQGCIGWMGVYMSMGLASIKEISCSNWIDILDLMFYLP